MLIQEHVLLVQLKSLSPEIPSFWLRSIWLLESNSESLSITAEMPEVCYRGQRKAFVDFKKAFLSRVCPYVYGQRTYGTRLP